MENDAINIPAASTDLSDMCRRIFADSPYVEKTLSFPDGMSDQIQTILHSYGLEKALSFPDGMSTKSLFGDSKEGKETEELDRLLDKHHNLEKAHDELLDKHHNLEKSHDIQSSRIKKCAPHFDPSPAWVEDSPPHK